MELCAGGMLLDAIVESRNFTERKAAAYLRKMVEVVDYCHQLRVFHRDLKPGTLASMGAQCGDPARPTHAKHTSRSGAA